MGKHLFERLPATNEELILEAVHLDALQKYFLEDSSSDEALNKIAKIAAVVCETQFAAISILERDRQWFKAKVGSGIEKTPWNYALCNYTIKGEVPVVVEDTILDPRFRDNCVATSDPKVRFYAAAPIITEDGDVLGTVCAIDSQPKSISPDKIEVLKDLAELASHTIDAHRRSKLLSILSSNVNKLGSLLPVCYKCRSIKTEKGDWMLLENFLINTFGSQLSHGICERCSSDEGLPKPE